jgi:hypothetical protein
MFKALFNYGLIGLGQEKPLMVLKIPEAPKILD